MSIARKGKWEIEVKPFVSRPKPQPLGINAPSKRKAKSQRAKNKIIRAQDWGIVLMTPLRSPKVSI